MGVGTLLGRVFGTEKAIEAAVDGVSKGLDALVYTEEEKANEASKDRAEARGMLIRWMETTNGQHLARRVIALSITSIWLLQYVFAWVVSIAGVFSSPDAQEQLARAADMTTKHADGMTGAVMLILAFYFAAPHMDKIVGTALGRFGGKS